MKIEFKPAFIERYEALTQFKEFKKESLTPLHKSIRVNTLKIQPKDLIKRMQPTWITKPIPWCKQGFFISHKDGRKDIGNTLESVLGYFHVQEASSMIPPLVLNPKPGDIVLDLCASPGSKTTQMAAMMNHKGLIIANDCKPDRIKALAINLQKSGAQNVITTLRDGNRFSGYKFDKILVDAPCSGTGTIKKSLKTISIWNPGMVRRLAHIQKRLITTAFGNLKVGGTLVYSTCSVEPEENEGIIDYLLSTQPNAQTMSINLPLNQSPTIKEFNGTAYNSAVKESLRIWPQDNHTCGFFITKITKSSSIHV